MDDLTKIIIAILGGGILGQPLVHLIISYQKRKLKKVTDTLEANPLFEKYEAIDFKKDFVLPNLIENYFYSQTGISTNIKTIPKYIEFKNELGKHYTWKTIKEANNHLNISGEKIEVHLSKFQKSFMKITLVFSFTIFFLSLIGMVYLDYKYQASFSDKIVLLTLFIIIIVVCIFLVRGVSSIITANQMERAISKSRIKSTDES